MRRFLLGYITAVIPSVLLGVGHLLTKGGLIRAAIVLLLLEIIGFIVYMVETLGKD